VNFYIRACLCPKLEDQPDLYIFLLLDTQFAHLIDSRIVMWENVVAGKYRPRPGEFLGTGSSGSKSYHRLTGER